MTFEGIAGRFKLILTRARRGDYVVELAIGRPIVATGLPDFRTDLQKAAEGCYIDTTCATLYAVFHSEYEAVRNWVAGMSRLLHAPPSTS
jgi:hypothetical protein